MCRMKPKRKVMYTNVHRVGWSLMLERMLPKWYNGITNHKLKQFRLGLLTHVSKSNFEPSIFMIWSSTSNCTVRVCGLGTSFRSLMKLMERFLYCASNVENSLVSLLGVERTAPFLQMQYVFDIEINTFKECTHGLWRPFELPRAWVF